MCDEEGAVGGPKVASIIYDDNGYKTTQKLRLPRQCEDTNNMKRAWKGRVYKVRSPFL